MFNPSEGKKKKKLNITSKHPFVSVTIYLIFLLFITNNTIGIIIENSFTINLFFSIAKVLYFLQK